jgi:hypothetical protein
MLCFVLLDSKCVFVLQNLTKKAAAAQKGKKRSLDEQESFFCWFSDHGDAGKIFFSSLLVLVK